MSLACASASSQYIRNNAGISMPIPTPRAFGCWFKTSTVAQQTLMWSHRQTAFGVVQFTQRLFLSISGATVRVGVEVQDLTVPVQANIVTSAGIAIAGGGWNFAACSIASGTLDVWLYTDFKSLFTGSTSHSVTLGTLEVRHSIGAEWPGATYMDGEIAHACAWDDTIDAKIVEQMARCGTPPPIAGKVAASNLIYWFPLIDTDYTAWYGQLPGARLGQKIVMDAQNTPTVSDENPSLYPLMGPLGFTN